MATAWAIFKPRRGDPAPDRRNVLDAGLQGAVQRWSHDAVFEIGDDRGVLDHRHQLFLRRETDEIEVGRTDHQTLAVEQQPLEVDHLAQQRDLEPGAPRRGEQMVPHGRLVVGPWRDQTHPYSAARGARQRAGHRECQIWADHDDLPAGRVDHRHQIAERGRVGAAVKRPQGQARQVGVAGAGPATPGRLEIERQPVGRPPALHAQHEIMPCEIVVAEIDPADVGGVVGDDQLLMVSGRIVGEQSPDRVGASHADAGPRQSGEHGVRRLHLLPQRRRQSIAPAGHPAIADHEA